MSPEPWVNIAVIGQEYLLRGAYVTGIQGTLSVAILQVKGRELKGSGELVQDIVGLVGGKQSLVTS